MGVKFVKNRGLFRFFTIIFLFSKTILTYDRLSVLFYIFTSVYIAYNIQRKTFNFAYVTRKYIYALELKLNSTPAKALQQILKKEYLRPYQTDKRKK
jgi:hypothetical protein